MGKAFSETDKLIAQASGPPRVETVSDLCFKKMLVLLNYFTKNSTGPGQANLCLRAFHHDNF